MENLSYCRKPSRYASQAALTKRTASCNETTNFLRITMYDDVFGGPPRFGTYSRLAFSPRPEDYTEIFGGFTLLDAGRSRVSFGRPDHYEIYGYVSNGGSFEPIDSALVFDVSYHKAARRSNGDQSNGTDGKNPPLRVTDGACFNEIFVTVPDINLRTDVPPPSRPPPLVNVESGDYQLIIVLLTYYCSASAGVNDAGRSRVSFGRPDHYEIYGYVSNGGSFEPIDSALVFDVSYHKAARRSNGDQSNGTDGKNPPLRVTDGACFNEIFVTVPDINLRTDVPPPSRPPPLVNVESGDYQNGQNAPSGGTMGHGSPPFFDVEIDASLAIAASAAAMKEAMDKAQEKDNELGVGLDVEAKENGQEEKQTSKSNENPERVHEYLEREEEKKMLGDVFEQEEIEKKEEMARELEENKAEKQKRERELKNERLRTIEVKREREMEKDRIRMVFNIKVLDARERRYHEAHERAERDALERKTAEAHQRAMEEAHDRLGKACAKAREKSSMEAGLKEEHAAVERENTEAREHIVEKAMTEMAAFEARERVEQSMSDKFSSSSRHSGLRTSSSSSVNQLRGVKLDWRDINEQLNVREYRYPRSQYPYSHMSIDTSSFFQGISAEMLDYEGSRSEAGDGVNEGSSNSCAPVRQGEEQTPHGVPLQDHGEHQSLGEAEEGPVAVDFWLNDINIMLDGLHCSEMKKLDGVVLLLQGQAHIWCTNVTMRVPSDQDCPLMIGQPVQSERSAIVSQRGSTYSYISSKLVRDLGIQLEAISIDVNMTNPLGHSARVNQIYRECPIRIQGIEFPTNIIELPFDEFEVILGIDWWYRYYANADCQLKWVILRSSDGLEVIVVSERINPLYNVISVMLAKKLMLQGFQVFITNVIDTRAAEMRSEDIPVG
ncbi:hypothetical protein F3Y22_tig00110733pilonHSYRG00255 [Hibiscus syriacus]|uniref:Uncharacterized protein n=1 Tax=Hibiscus syriacus TaxID=106335 RepID=A0A6A2ZTG9_HIBSY|nr:hypothetical protein F3Y22_tig00110733pilonHSYRG00255 [Hibiscus syriacus]